MTIMSNIRETSAFLDQASGRQLPRDEHRLTGRESVLLLSAFATLALSIASLLTL